MTRCPHALAVLMGVFALAGCSSQSAGRSVICPSGKPMVLETNDSMGVQSNGEACAANWGSRLAKSSEPFSIVSRVTQEQCAQWADDYGTLVAKEGGKQVDAQSYRDAQKDRQRRIAEFAIVQTRAGDCVPT